MENLTRRQFYMGSAATIGITCLSVGGCGGKTGDDKTSIEVIEGAAIVGVKVGERLVTFPHPTVRIVGVILITTGTLVVTYLEWKTFVKQREEIRLTQDEAEKLKSDNRIVVQRKDGQIEYVHIDEIKYS